jgi:hypothetical protein
VSGAKQSHGRNGNGRTKRNGKKVPIYFSAEKVAGAFRHEGKRNGSKGSGECLSYFSTFLKECLGLMQKKK